jgi:hypothetical protein
MLTLAHLFEIVAVAAFVALIASPAVAGGLRVLNGNVPEAAEADIQTADQDVVHDLCNMQHVPSDLACAFPSPTPKHPERYVVLLSNDLPADQQKLLTFGMRRMDYR